MAGWDLWVNTGIIIKIIHDIYTPAWFMAHPEYITHVHPDDIFEYAGAMVYWNSPNFTHAESPDMFHPDYLLPWSSASGPFAGVYIPDAWNHLQAFYAWDAGAFNVVCYHIDVNPMPKPVAAFHATPLSGEAPLQVQFTDDSTNTPASWIWDFGAGILSDLQNPLVTYLGAGIYTVKLIATNAAGSDQETKTDYITVLNPTPRYKPQSRLNICTPT